MPDHSKWRNKQIDAAVSLGVNILDAVAAVDAFLAVLPPGADPNTYVVPARDMAQDVSDPKWQADAVAAWVGREDVPNKDKLILSAGDE